MTQQQRHQPHRWIRIGAVTGTALLLAATVAPADAGPNDSISAELREAVTPKGIAEHLKALDRIAKANDGTRASGTPGYAASRDYIVGKLEASGYTPTVQAFDFPFFREYTPATMAQISPVPTTYANPGDFTSMTYSFSGDVTGTVVAVDTDGTPSAASTSGCEASDFSGFPSGAIALMQRGTCTFATKALNAQNAGAPAAIVFNRGTDGSTATVAGTLGSPLVEIPVVGSSHAVGLDLMNPAGTTVRIVSDTESEIRETWNVFAETAGGDAKNVVMAGAHLDSVVVGPGVNDNGSGSAALLEIAEQFTQIQPTNKVRLAWWGAEELGLLGSEHYVSDLAEKHPSTLKRIAMYLNFDMIGSPNYVRFVYDGDNSRFPVGPGAAAGPEGSGPIEQLFHDYFGSQDLASEETAFSGRSDYGPFIAEGIPAGGLFTGAEGVKTEEQAAIFGGDAGVAYDVCYHQACDDFGNVNMTAVDEMSDAVAHAILTYAMSTYSVNGNGDAPSVSGAEQTSNPTGTGTTGGGGLHDEDGHERDAS